ncbi:MAG: TIGR00341 family protein [Gemmatimonadota bacterium]
MSGLRLVEAVVPIAALEGLVDEIAANGVIDVWSYEAGDGRGLLRILIESEGTEGLTDQLAERFSREEGYRLMLLPVEATYPRVEKKESAEEEKRAEEEKVWTRKGPLRISREELHQDLSVSTRISAVYLTTVGLSTLVAAVGLMSSSVAVVIGAMVIAPLLGPNVALSLAATLGDLDLAWDALKANLAGISVALVLSVVVGVLLPVDPTVPEIAGRTDVDLGDMVLALAAGAAGTLAFTQGLSAAVIGVMVAVALLPPLVAAGLLLGAGEIALAYGAFLLVAVNVTCVNLAGVVTFLMQKVQPRTWWETERATKAAKVAVASWIGMLLLLVLLIWL